MSNRHSESGFTLIEMMVALAISVVVAAGTYEVYLQMNKYYTSQQMKVNLEQTARNALDTMSREISNAGYGGQMIMVNYDPPEIEFSEYLQDKGTSATQIRYRFDKANGEIWRGEIYPATTAVGDYTNKEYVIAKNVSGLVFSYYTNYTQSNPIYPPDYVALNPGSNPATIDLSNKGKTNIRQISVLLSMQSSKKDPTIPDDVNHNYGHRTTVLKATLLPLNLAEGQGGPVPLIAPPANVYAWDNRDCSSLEIKWDAVTDPTLSGYKILWGTAAGVYNSGVDVPVSQLADPKNPEYKLTGLQITKYTDAAPTTYHIVVYSVNSVGDPGDPSAPEVYGPQKQDPRSYNYTSFNDVQSNGDNDTTLNAQKPAPPTPDTGTSSPASNKVQLTWTGSSDATVGYRLYRSTSQFTTFPIPDSYRVADESVLIPGTTSYTDTVPLNCTDYYYAICSVNCDNTYIYGSTTKSGYNSDDYYQFAAAQARTDNKPPVPSLAVQSGWNRVFVNLGNPLLTVDPDFDHTILYWSKNAHVPTPDLTTGADNTAQTVFNHSGNTSTNGYFLQQGSGGDNYFVFNDEHASLSGTQMPDLDPTATYHFLAVTFDKCSGDFSVSPEVSAQPQGLCSSPGAPAAIKGLTASGCGDTIDLTWNPDTETYLAGYRVYKNYSNSFGGPPDFTTGARGGSTCISGTFAIPTTATPSFTDPTVQDGETDWYAVSATDCEWENMVNPSLLPPPPQYTTAEYQSVKTNNITTPALDISLNANGNGGASIVGPINPGRLRLYATPIMHNPPSGSDMYNFVTTSGVNPADNSATAFHNAVTFYIQNTSAGNITLNNISLAWSNQAAYLKEIIIGGSPQTWMPIQSLYTTPVSEATAAGGEAVGVTFSDTSAKATGAGVYSQAIPVTLVFTNSDGSVTSATDMNGDTLGVTLAYENNSTGSSFCTQSFTVPVPMGPRIYNSTVSIPDYGYPAFQDVSSMDPAQMDHPVAVGARNTDVHALLAYQAQYAFQNGSSITMQNIGISGANVYVATTDQGTRYPTGATFQPVANITTNTAAGSVTGTLTCANNSIDATIPPEDGNRVWYYFTVQAQDGNHERLPATDNGYFMYDQSNWDPCSFQPLPPQSPTCTATSSGVITLSWTAPTKYTDGNVIVSPLYPSTTQLQDPLKYQIYKKLGAGSAYSSTPYATTTSTTYTDGTALPNPNTTAYCYKIVAVNSCTTSPKPSAYSDEVVVATPNPPSSVVASRSSVQSPDATLTWTAPGLNTDGNTLTNLSGFYIYLNGSLVATVSSTTTSCSWTTLTPGNSYTFGVAAYNSYGVTSSVVSVKP